MPELKEISSNRCFGGYQKVFSHESNELRCAMNFSVYLPPQAQERNVPVIYWLSGLSCNEQNFIQKAGAQKYAAEHGVILIGPDTSPRGLNLPGEGDSWDFGRGAGFYVDAITEPWDKHYRMYSYVTKELFEIVNTNFPILAEQQSIMGHSMGGHGALICALKNPGKYRCVSAFAPICNPINCAWGKKAFTGYLGLGNILEWKKWDATELVKEYDGPPLNILIDQGAEDEYLKNKQLLPENFVTACQESHTPVILKMQEGYDHTYFFIASFIGNHLEFHVKHLKSPIPIVV